MKFLLLFLTLFTLNGRAQTLSSSVIPLDPEAESALKESSLADEVKSADHDQQAFHKKAFIAFKKVEKKIDLKKYDPMFFVYDCLFLSEEGFFKKYSDLKKSQLVEARKIVVEELK